MAKNEGMEKHEEFKAEFKKRVKEQAKMLYRKSLDEISDRHKFVCVAYAVKDIVIDQWIATQKAYDEKDAKIVYYLSIEFLMGRALGNMIINLSSRDEIKEAIEELGLDLNVIEDQEPDAALGNGGLGRLAACFLDSLSTLNYPAYGCGIRYKYGMFQQKIENGYQKEIPEDWLRHANPLEIKREEYACEVKFGGYVRVENRDGRNYFIQEGYQSVNAIPYDMPIVGYGNNVVNTLRIWDAEPVVHFNLDEFDKGSYMAAVEQENLAKTITEVLYPNDNHYAGKELRLKQQYFFVSASLQTAIKKYLKNHDDIRKLPEKVVFQMNDTHPTLTVAELMRLLMDEYNLEWDEAWNITINTVSYTNHTIMTEAMERWPKEMLKTLLPRIYMIIEEIDRRYMNELEESKYDHDKIYRMSIIDNNDIKMANLSIVGSHSVNGVAKLHTELLKKEVLKDFYDHEPEKFNNKTNGIAHRRWLISSNTELSDLITGLISEDWKTDTRKLKELEAHRHDKAVLEKIGQIKYNNKERLAKFIKEKYDIDVNPNSIFDVQIKRLHAYKRQLLNALHILHLYHELLENPNFDMEARTFIFGAKAAPGYYLAKCIIKFINSLAEKINNDPRIDNKIKVVFIENYDVSKAELIIPAADVSEQISTTTKEASGTGNMKLMMNGAITLATLDGANIEIFDQVGEDNIVIFGLSANEVLNYNKFGGYSALDLYNSNRVIKRVVDDLVNGFIPNMEKEGRQIYDSLITYNDEYFVLRDMENYIEAQEKIDRLYKNKEKWNEMALINIANSGVFSSDRTIAEYAEDIWFKGCE